MCMGYCDTSSFNFRSLYCIMSCMLKQRTGIILQAREVYLFLLSEVAKNIKDALSRWLYDYS
jgi:hypothetical protein